MHEEPLKMVCRETCLVVVILKRPPYFHRRLTEPDFAVCVRGVCVCLRCATQRLPAVKQSRRQQVQLTHIGFLQADFAGGQKGR